MLVLLPLLVPLFRAAFALTLLLLLSKYMVALMDPTDTVAESIGRETGLSDRNPVSIPAADTTST